MTFAYIRTRFHSSLKGNTTILQHQQVLLTRVLQQQLFKSFKFLKSILRHVFNRNNSAYISCCSMFCEEIERIFYNNVYCCYCCGIRNDAGEDWIWRNSTGSVSDQFFPKCKYGSISCIAMSKNMRYNFMCNDEVFSKIKTETWNCLTSSPSYFFRHRLHILYIINPFLGIIWNNYY